MMLTLRSPRATRRGRASLRPQVDGLESRLVLSATHPVAQAHHAAGHHAKVHHPAASKTPAPTPQTGTVVQPLPTPSPITSAPVTTLPALNNQVVTYLAGKLGQRIGSGECADLAVEALRVAGAEFTGIAPDSPAPGDYVWGSLVKTISAPAGQALDSAPGTAIQPGDVLQFSNATFANGVTASHHTAVVGAVDALGRVTQVFQQNILEANGTDNRTDTLSNLDLTQLTSGSVAVYQPITRPAATSLASFTVVNNAPTPETIALGGAVVTLAPANTLGSLMTFSSTMLPQVALNGLSYALSSNGGYQVVGTGATAVLQAVS